MLHHGFAQASPRFHLRVIITLKTYIDVSADEDKDIAETHLQQTIEMPPRL